jgi:CRP-like cAMP-binding protein
MRQRLLSNVMNSSALFAPFNKSDRRMLVEKFRARDVQKGEVLIREGERSDGLYIVLSGEVEVKKGHQLLAHLKEGEVFGEMSLLQKTPASATVQASKRTSLLRLPREQFDEIVLSHPQILMLVSELTDSRKKETEALLSGKVKVSEDGLMLV